MEYTMPQQAPAFFAPADRRTYYQVLTDPALTAPARVAFAIMFRPIDEAGIAQIRQDDIARYMGYSMRQTRAAIAELENAGIFVSKPGGRGFGKFFALGPAMRGGIDAEQMPELVETSRAGGSGNVGRLHVVKRPSVATQEALQFAATENLTENSRSLSSSHAIARGKLVSNRDPGNVVSVFNNTTTTIGARNETSSSSSSETKQKLTARGMAESSADRCLRDRGADYCERQLAVLDRRLQLQARKGDPVRDVGGWLYKSIMQGWPDPPATYTPQRWQIENAERQMQVIRNDASGERVRRIAIANGFTPKPREEIIAETTAEYAALEKYFAALPQAARTQIETKAAELAKSFGNSPAAERVMRFGLIEKHARICGGARA